MSGHLNGRPRGSAGFTILEFAVVIIFVAILAAIAIPDFLKFQAKSNCSEPKTNLDAIFTTQISYFSENNTCADGEICNVVNEPAK